MILLWTDRATNCVVYSESLLHVRLRKSICSSNTRFFGFPIQWWRWSLRKLQKTTLTGTVSNFQQYCQSVSNRMFCEPVNFPELVSIIKNMKKNKSPGPDNIGTSILNQIAPSILHPLLHIINLSFSSGSVPDSLKIAKVVPVFKKR